MCYQLMLCVFVSVCYLFIVTAATVLTIHLQANNNDNNNSKTNSVAFSPRANYTD
jgi:hypothetical protein